jgi:signal transduction histidine kinase
MFETVRPRDEIEGSGMGLAIVRRYVEALGGTIGVISDEGRGSTFRFTWPKQPSASGGGRRPQVAP